MAERKEDFEEKVSYILGIVSIISAFILPIAALISGIIGFLHSRKSARELSLKAKKLNIIGIILGAVLLAITIAIAVYTGLDSLNQLNLPGS
jgi:hypothetical protein